MRNNNNNSNPTCRGIELEELYNRLISFYDDNYFEYWDNKEVDAKLKETGKLLRETLDIVELQIRTNSQAKLDNWIRNSNNQ